MTSNQHSSSNTAVMGDFKAKLGSREKVEERYGIGELNDREDRMAAIAETNKLFVSNSWLQTKARRRWIAPNAKSEKEI